MSRWLLALIALFIGSEVAAQTPSPEYELGTVAEFARHELGPYRGGFLDHPRRDEDFRRRARAGSTVEIVSDADLDTQVLRVRVTDASLFAEGPLPLLRLAPFYPPEADALRFRVKVVSGKVRAFAGGPTAYYGNSDVFTKSAELSAAVEPQWADLDISLNHPLRRNNRRAGFSTDAERNYYSRWAQEPLGVFLEVGTVGEFLIERIECVSRREGRPFKNYERRDVQTIRWIADFNGDASAEDLFTLYMADGEEEWFEESWRREKPLRFAPQQLEIVPETVYPRRGKVLEAVGTFAEEVHCAGIRTTGAPGANAIRFDVRHDARDYANTVVGWGYAEPLDVLVFVAPQKPATPWQAFAASDELRKLPGPGFDFQFAYRRIRERQDVDFAIYQTRRYLTPREWTTLVLPAADFVCVYGSGAYRERFLRNQPLTCDDVTAVAWLVPWCRAGRSAGGVKLRLDDFVFVRVPGSAAEHRSFWQLPADAKVEWRESSRPPYGRERIMLVDGEKW